jgi:hypothetical protein
LAFVSVSRVLTFMHKFCCQRMHSTSVRIDVTKGKDMRSLLVGAFASSSCYVFRICFILRTMLNLMFDLLTVAI